MIALCRLFRDPVKRVTHLVLNSGLWSPRYDNDDLPASLPDEHMNWVAQQLALAHQRHDQVVLSSHIPPGKLVAILFLLH